MTNEDTRKSRRRLTNTKTRARKRSENEKIRNEESIDASWFRAAFPVSHLRNSRESPGTFFGMPYSILVSMTVILQTKLTFQDESQVYGVTCKFTVNLLNGEVDNDWLKVTLCDGNCRNC